MPYYTYILKTADNRFYIGSTKDLTARVNRHNRGECRFTGSRLPVLLVYQESFSSRAQAVQREKQLKSWKSNRSLDNLIKRGPIV